MAVIADGLRDMFLVSVGAVAMGAEKSKEMVDQLIAKGESTVGQGKQLNVELKHQAVNATSGLREDSIAAQLSVMTKEERDAFAAKVAEMAAAANEKEAANAKADAAEAAEGESAQEAEIIDVEPVVDSAADQTEPEATRGE